MRKIVIAIASTVSALVLLFSYHTSTNSPAAKQATTDTNAGTGNSGGTTPNSGSDGTYTGDPAATRFGDVQVQIIVTNGKITSADAVQYPNGNRHDQQINAYAIPILNSEVVDAQSATIDAVSGATVTSDGYISSLQSAIDAAHLR
jgi:uncharacterized protein with FMN-binding domain